MEARHKLNQLCHCKLRSLSRAEAGAGGKAGTHSPGAEGTVRSMSVLQTHTPGGEPTQSCQEKSHVPRDGTEGARPSWGTQHPSHPAGGLLKVP